MVGFPLLLIPLAIYNIIAFLMPGVSFTDPLVRVPLMSGLDWPVTLSDILLALGILMLMLEVIKGARPGAKYLTDHLLSFILFGAAAAEFVLWPKFGTSTYFLLVLLAMVEFFSGVALRARRGMAGRTADVASRSVASKAGAPKVTQPAEEPPVAAAPKPVPPATSVAESALLDRSEPRTGQPPASGVDSSPQVASPGLQPGNIPPSSPEH